MCTPSVVPCRSSLLSTLRGKHVPKLPRKGELTLAMMTLVSVRCGPVFYGAYLVGVHFYEELEEWPKLCVLEELVRRGFEAI